MDCLQIDWKNIDGEFERDEFYENIQAPKWIDFTAPLQPVDDHEWFCGSVGCNHEKKDLCESFNQDFADAFSCQKEGTPLADGPSSAVYGEVKKTRNLISSSFSSLAELKSSYKNRHMYQVLMPPISEQKCESAKKPSRPKPNENDNPNQVFKALDAASKKTLPKALDFTMKKTKDLSNNKEQTKDVPTTKEPRPHHPLAREVPSRVFKNVFSNSANTDHIIHSQAPKKDNLNAKVSKKDPISDTHESCKPKARPGPLRVRPPRPAPRNPHLTASLSVPMKRRSLLSPKSFRGGPLNKDKSSVVRSSTSKSMHIRGFKSVKASYPKGSELITDENVNNKQETKQSNVQSQVDKVSGFQELTVQKTKGTLKDVKLLGNKDDSNKLLAESSPVIKKTKDEEVSIQNTLNQFLSNLHITTPGNLLKNLSENVHPEPLNARTEEETHEDDEESMRCSSHSADSSQLNKLQESQDGSFAMSLASHESNHDIPELIPSMSSSNKNNARKVVKTVKDWQIRSIRKSAELSFKRRSLIRTSINRSSIKDLKSETQKAGASSSAFVKNRLTSQPSKRLSISRLQVKVARAPVQSEHNTEACEEPPKKVKPSCKPFRFRTEERGAQRDLARKEVRRSKQDLLALRMPPFRPQRSTKKLTIPKEPNFQTLRTRRTKQDAGEAIPPAS